jgi:hypothetical protein
MMSLLGFARWLAATPWSIALHESVWMYPIIESVHVLTLCCFVGMSVVLDLRLLGLTLRRFPVSELTDRLLPWMVAGFIVMVLSGAALFYAIPVRSYQNIFFRAKMILLVSAGLNASIFHSTVHRHVSDWDLDPVPPTAARMAASFSLILWASIIVCGRMIAYNWFDCDKPQSAIVNVLSGCTTDSR